MKTSASTRTTSTRISGARKLAVAAVIAAAGGAALGSSAAFADDAGASLAVPAGHTVCVDLPTNGGSGHANGVADVPVRFTLLVQPDGASGFTLVSESAGATTHWQADIPGETGYVVRVVRACATNQGSEDTSAFLTIETDENDDVPAPAETGAVAAESSAAAEPAAVIVDDSFGSGVVQGFADRVEQLVAELVAALAG